MRSYGRDANCYLDFPVPYFSENTLYLRVSANQCAEVAFSGRYGQYLCWASKPKSTSFKLVADILQLWVSQ